MFLLVKLVTWSYACGLVRLHDLNVVTCYQDDFLELEAEPCHTGMDLNTIETSVRVGGGRYTQVFQGHSSVHNRELAVKVKGRD